MADILDRIINGACFVPSVMCLAILVLPMLLRAIIYIITWPFRLIDNIFGGRR
jgi:hypothetical protein